MELENYTLPAKEICIRPAPGTSLWRNYRREQQLNLAARGRHRLAAGVTSSPYLRTFPAP